MRYPALKYTLLCGFMVFAAFARPAMAETLAEALADAYRQNPDLLAKRAELRAIDESLPAARSGYFPKLSIDGSAGLSRVDSSGFASSSSSSFSIDGNRRLNPKNAEISVTQPIYRGGRTVAATARARSDILAGQNDLAKTEQAVLLDAVTAFMDVLRDRAVLELNQNNEKVLKRQLDATTDRFNVGELSRTDVAQSESRAARATAGVVTAQGQLAVSETRFLKIIGRLPVGDMVVPDPATGLPGTRDDALSMAVANNPAIAAARMQQQSAAFAVDEVSGRELPELNLKGAASTARERSRERDQQDSYSLLAQLSFPFYQGGAVAAETRQAREIASQKQLQILSATRQVTEQAAQAWDDWNTAKANIDAYNAAIKSAETALTGVREEQQVGSRSVLDLLDAEQELLDAKVSLVRARRDGIVASYAILSAIGKLNAADLKLAVDIYNPLQHDN